MSMSRNTIRESDWTSALVTESRTADEVIKSIKKGRKTALVANARVLSQQAEKYARDCPVIVCTLRLEEYGLA